MTLLAKFIDSLHVHFYRSAFRQVIHPVHLNGIIEKHNVLIYLNKGNMFIGEQSLQVPEKSFVFIPSGHSAHIKYGKGEYKDLGKTGFISDEHRELYMRNVNGREDLNSLDELITIIGFDVLLYDAIPFFEVLEIPVFQLPQDEELQYLICHLAMEHEFSKLGKEKIMSNYMEEIIIHVCRYIESQPDFKKYIDKLEFLTDRRLVDIVKYIRENLDKDLSNKTIANIAYISEDYVGQFFKTLTGKNLQDYIENQRLERAMFLLRTQPDNIQEIAHKVGFKDPAYFSRRFKMKFGANANAVRQNRDQVA